MKYTAQQLAKLAIDSDPRCIKDRQYFQAWCNAYQAWEKTPKEIDNHAEFASLIRKHDTLTLERERERYLEQHRDIPPRYESTDSLRRELLGGEVGLL